MTFKPDKKLDSGQVVDRRDPNYVSPPTPFGNKQQAPNKVASTPRPRGSHNHAGMTQHPAMPKAPVRGPRRV